MMLSILPDDIYMLIIKYCLTYDDGDNNIRKMFKHNLHLLQICHRWRQLALPFVYKAAFITYQETNDTNLDLVEAANCTDVVRNMCMNLYYSTDSSNKLAQIVNLAKNCFQVQHLQINLHHDTSTHVEQLPGDLPKIDFYSIFPKVISLKFNGKRLNPADDMLYSHIAQQYAHQLQYLDSKYPISSDCKFEMLKYVSINAYGASNYKIPQMSAEYLEKISLYNVPSDFSWDSFEGSEFSNLKELSIYYTFASNKSQQISTRRLLFPKLRIFDVDGISDEYPVLNQAIFPEEIDRLFIFGYGDMYRSARNVRLPRAKRLGISTSLDDDDNTQAASYMNQLVKNAAKAKTVYFRIYNNVPISIGDLTCTNITDLYIKTRVSIEIMLSLISTLHNLVNLDLCRLIGDNSTQYAVLPEADEQPLVPFNSKLEHLVLNFETQLELNSNIVDVLVYMLLKLPMLKKMMCEQLSKPFIYKLEPFIKVYPYLQAISYGVSPAAIEEIGNVE